LVGNCRSRGKENWNNVSGDGLEPLGNEGVFPKKTFKGGKRATVRGERKKGEKTGNQKNYSSLGEEKVNCW